MSDNTNDRALVVRHMITESDNLPADIFVATYLLCDGYGVIDAKFANDNCFDRSHVRDSSDEAIARMAGFLRDRGHGEKTYLVTHKTGMVHFEVDEATARAMGVIK